MEIGQKLKGKRTALGLSQEQLASRLGGDPAHRCQLGKGKDLPGYLQRDEA